MSDIIHVLVEHNSDLGPVFQVTPERFDPALDRRPALKGRVRATFSTDLDRFHEAISSADAMIGWRFPHRDIAALAPRLRWIQLTGAGVNHLAPFDWVPPGVVLTNNRGVHGPKCEEFVAMPLLLLANRIPEIRANQAAKRWALTYSRSVVGQRVAVLGVGSMGGAAARAARRLWMDVVGVRRMFTPERLEEAVADADFVVVSTPLTAATRNMVGARELGWMKPGVNLINISRGGVVDGRALGRALAEGRVAGALLDVFDREPLPPDAEEWDLPNTVVTPHCSSDDAASYIPRTLDLFLDNLDRLLAGVPLRGRVDPVLEY